MSDTEGKSITMPLWLTYNRSSRNPGYDANDSRRSPARDRSPGRYPHQRGTDQYQGGGFRGNGERRRSFDARLNNQSNFAQNRELFTEPTRRESARDVQPPQGPRVNPHDRDERSVDRVPPTGPRREFRQTDSPYRGNDFVFRGRGRGISRGRGWQRDPSRERGRDTERGEYRAGPDRREDRGSAFRNDRSRDTWDRESFRGGRRQQSPQMRGRSPNYGNRDPRDTTSTLDLDRNHRSGRDVPTVSPSGDFNPSFPRGYGRVKSIPPPRGGGRGRGYSGYHEDRFDRQSSYRSRSPEPLTINRRTLQSTSPPPQVPAFGSATVKATTPVISTPGNNTFAGATSTSTPAASLPPTVPKGPRVSAVAPPQLPYNSRPLHRASSATWVRPPERPSPEIRNRETDLFPAYVAAKDDNSAQDNASTLENSSIPDEVMQNSPHQVTMPNIEPQSAKSRPTEQPISKKRLPSIGRRHARIPSPIPTDSDLDSDSEAEFGDDYFEEEISNVKAEIAQVEERNPLLPPVTPVIATDWRPFYEPIIDNVIPDPCEAPSIQQEVKETAPVAPTMSMPVASVSGSLLPEPPAASEPPAAEEARSIAPVPPTEPVTGEPSPVLRPVTTPSAEKEENRLDKVTAPVTETMTLSQDVDMQDEAAKPSVLVDATPIDQDAQVFARKEAETIPSQPLESIQPIKPAPPAQQPPPPVNPDVPKTNGVSHPPLLPTSTTQPTFAPELDKISSVPEPVAPHEPAELSNGHNATDVDEPGKLDSPAVAANVNHVKRAMMDQFEDSEDSANARELEEECAAVRRSMKTPPLDSLPQSSTGSFWDNQELVTGLEIRSPRIAKAVKSHIHALKLERRRVERDEGEAWAKRYYQYRKWTDTSMDEVAVRSRETFAKSRAQAEKDAAAPTISALASASAKPEGRRTQSRFATERDIERIMEQSAAEAKEKEQDERSAREKTANAKEATIPAMMDGKWWQEHSYLDKTHMVSFNRSFATLEYGEPIDNFSPEEAEIFEKAYLEAPKNWSHVADALIKRDFKACIQHYYLVKHSAKLKEKSSSKKKKRGRGPAKKQPKASAMAAMDNGEDADENEDNDNGGRPKGRPRRAAAPRFPISASEAPAPNESESGTPAPTPGRKTAGAPKQDGGSESGPPKKKAKVARESKSKQSKNNPLLAAAPITAATRRDDSPMTPIPPPVPLQSKAQRASAPTATGPGSFPLHFDGPSTMVQTLSPTTNQTLQPLPLFNPLVFQTVPIVNSAAPALVERPPPSMTANFEVMPQTPKIPSQPQTPQQPPPQPFPGPDHIGSTTPSSFDTNQDRRNLQQTSSYWSVPEQQDFPALLRHFGTDWQGIAKHMTSKTHIMVYTNLFQQWLAMPSDSNKSRRVANIQAQVKNYYQRQVDSGKKEWEDTAKEADGKRERGESTGLPPTPSQIPKRQTPRYDTPSGSLPPRSGSAMDGMMDDIPSPGPSIMQAIRPAQSSPHQSQTPSKFPVLANAGTAPHLQATTSSSSINKHVTPQPQSAGPTAQPQGRPPGPRLGYFSESSQARPILQAARSDSAISQRSLKAAQAAQLEQEAAVRLQHEQAQQKEQRDRERQLRDEEQRQLQQQQRDQHEREQLKQREQARKKEEETAQLVQAAEEKRRQERQEAERRDQLKQLKQERLESSTRANLQQFEPYSTPTMHSNIAAHSRIEGPRAEQRRPLPEYQQQNQFQSRPQQSSRNFSGEGIKPPGSHREIREHEMNPTASPAMQSPVMHRPPPSATLLRNDHTPIRGEPPIRNDYGVVRNEHPSTRNERAPMRSEHPPMRHEPTATRSHEETPVRNDPYSTTARPHHIPQSHTPHLQATPQPPSKVTAVRQQETRKTSNIMDLLNNDPPEPARSEPPKPNRIASMSQVPQPPAQSHTPPPQKPSQANRFGSHQPTTQPQAMAQQNPTQPASQQPQPPHHQISHQVSHSPHPYSQASHPAHHHSSSIGQPRSYTPTSFDRRGYETAAPIPPPVQQQTQQQQNVYSQPTPRGPMLSQPAIRRESSLGDMHSLSSEYSRPSGGNQSSMRLKASPYGAAVHTPTPPPQAPQVPRQPIVSPLGFDTPGERDFYSRQPQSQFLMQQQSAAGSPQVGPYQATPREPSRLAFAQSQHVVSPPHFGSHQQHPQHQHQQAYGRSRHNSIDARDLRHPVSTSAGSTPSHAGYTQPPPHPAHPSMQYQQAHQDRFDNGYEQNRRIEEEFHRRKFDDIRHP